MLGTGKAHVVNRHDMLCQHPAKSFRLRAMKQRRSRLKSRKPVRVIRGGFFALVKQNGFAAFDLFVKDDIQFVVCDSSTSFCGKEDRLSRLNSRSG